ncbi:MULTISPECIES: sensor histidine kinase [unclassified Methylobacterium]|uniref:sensor histidine kinase n=1 Tax=unclassified Methylobacterium TaxID=2615210 RepID=UPI0006FE478A|nr:MULTISPECIES: sensor histidine kinase [unclassified Methylobacterium]KQO61002.1 histidine kinase [Methylobacterium sp. Leaf86]KQO94401.1 histidine kinase [Methylobacterium sp. Leaf91]
MPHPEPVVLILAPLGRDAMVAATILAEVGIVSKATSTLDDLVAHLDHAACAVMTEEALLHWDRQEIARWVERQPPWSDFPFVLLSYRGGPPDVRLTDLLGNVTVLERPFHPAVLANAVRSALRARRRQREVQAYLEERQRTHERQALLIRELHHRVKNTLATVQGLLGATARSTKDVDTFYQSFSDRIVSLGKTHNLLTEDYWQTAPLRDLLQNELGHYNDGTANRITLEGPPVELAADLAVPTGMAIHELTTNATKYGALSLPSGRVTVSWSVDQRDAERVLELRWTESGGPLVKAPERKGFGSTLLQRVLAQQCNADVDITYEAEGLHFRMVAPLPGDRLVPAY